jgi:hypothetical protein
MHIRSGGVRAAWLGLLLSGAAWPAPEMAGRWEGLIAIPGAPQWLIVDLDRDERGGWIGSAILPGRGVAGAPLAAIVVDGDTLKFDLTAALPYPAEQAPLVSARFDATGSLHGELTLNGLAAPLNMRRSGDAQVTRPPRSQPVDTALHGTWHGTYELFGQARQVSLRLGDKGAAMTITRPGRTTEIAFSLVRSNGRLLGLSGNEYDISYEGEAGAGVIAGTFLQGPLELPLEFRREKP